MTAAVDLLQLEDANLGVNGRCIQACVPQQLLDIADVGTTFEHVRGTGVA